MKKSMICALLVLIAGMVVMLGAGYRLMETNREYLEGDAVYDDLSFRIRRAADTSERPHQTVGSTAAAGELPPDEKRPYIYIPEYEIDFDTLLSVNKDSAAWLYSPGTVIDYPVMRADDYNYYLNHLADGTANANGTLFIDYNNAHDFSGGLTVIYGHHMKSGKMFGSLKGYKEQSYYDSHPYMYLYTQEGSFRIELMYGIVVAAGQWKEQAFMFEENLDAFLEHAMRNTTFKSDVKRQAGDRIIALSTCSYEFNDARYVVIGVLNWNA